MPVSSLRGRRGRGRSGAEQTYQIGYEFRTRAAAAQTEMLSIARHFGNLLKRRVRAKASGRPGPRTVSGRYHADLFYEVLHASGYARTLVGSYSPYARRLEFGFVGRDSLNRFYNQAPLPHFGPAADESEEDYVAAVARLADFDRKIGGL